MKPKAVGIIGTCPKCGEPVEFILTKKEVKALFKAFKLDSKSKAEIYVEKTILKRRSCGVNE